MMAHSRAAQATAFNLVTEAGEVFRADGEVVARSGFPRDPAPYLLSCTGEAGPASAAVGDEQQQETLKQLTKRLTTMRIEGMQLDERKLEAGREARLAEYKLKQLRALLEREAVEGGKLQKKLAAAEQAVTQAQKLLDSSRKAVPNQAEMLALEAQLTATAAAYEQLCVSITGDAALTEAETELAALRLKHVQAAKAVQDAQQSLGLEEARLQQLCEQLAAAEAMLDAADLDKLRQEAVELEASHGEAKDTSAGAAQAAAAAQRAAADHHKKAEANHRELAKAEAKRDAAQQALDDSKESLAEVTALLDLLQAELARAAAHFNGRADIEGDAGQAGGPERSEAASDEEASSSDSDSDTHTRSRQQRLARHTRSRRQPKSLSLAAVRAALAAHAAALQQMQERREGIDVGAVQEHLKCMSRSVELAAAVQTSRQTISRLEAETNALVRQRYDRFHSAMMDLNQHLSTIYRRLTGQGDTYISYCQDPVLCFLNGTALHIRPDSRQWRPFQLLSGGQQAVFCLALAFALQKVAPLPFYYFDEIDAALDTTNVERTAAYLLEQPDAQYILVSHRPEMYEKASLVGVYPSAQSHSSKAIMLHCASLAAAA